MGQFITNETWSGDPLEAARKRLLEACKIKVRSDGGTGGDNARYGGVCDDGVQHFYSYPCHRYMRSLVGARAVYSQFVHPLGSEKMHDATKAYFRWITGSKSPWWKVFVLGMSDQAMAPKYWFRRGFVFDRLDVVPGNFLQSFLVASRMPKEWPIHIKRWHAMVKAGVSEPAALFFEPMWYQSKFNPCNRYDYPLDHGSCDEEYLVNFCAGIAPNVSKPFVECKNGSNTIEYWPVNSVFGNNKIMLGPDTNFKPPTEKTYAEFVKTTYSPEFGKVEMQQANKYDTTMVETWTVPQRDQVRIIKAEERRLGLV